jgi:tetratricopeptide (TPR) repeat protein
VGLPPVFLQSRLVLQQSLCSPVAKNACQSGNHAVTMEQKQWESSRATTAGKEERAMAARGKHPPNIILRRLREERGWSLQRVADELRQIAEAENENRVPGVNANMVGVWERGWKRPSPFYQALFCQLYHRSAAQLGLARDDALLVALAEATQQEATRPANAVTHPSQLTLASEQTHAIDLLCCTTEATPQQQAGAWLALGASGVGQLLKEGWTLDEVLTALQVVLQGVHALPAINRRQLLQLGGAAMTSSIPMPMGEKASEEERVQFTNALGKSIEASWKLFHSANIQQVLAIGQAQLYILQQLYSLFHPDIRSLFLSAIYNLIGAVILFQGDYYNALRTHEKAYLAALEGPDALCMIQSLSWQAHGRKGLDQHKHSIRHIEAALQLLDQQTSGTSETCQRLKALLLADWAISASWLGEKTIAQNKLEASRSLLGKIYPNEEFDCERWYQQAGNCALICKDYQTAIGYLEKALTKLPNQWVVRQTLTLIPLAVAYASNRKLDESLAIAEKALSVIGVLNAPAMNKHFVEYMQHDLFETFPRDSKVAHFIADVSQRFPQFQMINSY